MLPQNRYNTRPPKVDTEESPSGRVVFHYFQLFIYNRLRYKYYAYRWLLPTIICYIQVLTTPGRQAAFQERFRLVAKLLTQPWLFELALTF